MAPVKSLVLIAALAAVAACSDPVKDSYPFEGQYYNAKAKSLEPKNRSLFTVTVKDAAKGLDGARQAAEYTATKYCVNMLGTSDITWSVAPDAPYEVIASEGGSITVAGTCQE